MADRLLISDANILIDMKVGGIIEAMFRLPFSYATPEILFNQELQAYHPELPDLGLKLLELEPAGIQRVVELGESYTGVSSNDLAALVLAEQTKSTLLTGDNRLRQVSIEQNIDVHGTVWLVEETLVAKEISIDQAKVAYQLMEEDGSRLPTEDIKKQIQYFRKHHL